MKIALIGDGNTQVADASAILIHQETRRGNGPLVLFDPLGWKHREEISSVQWLHQISFSHALLSFARGKERTEAWVDGKMGLSPPLLTTLLCAFYQATLSGNIHNCAPGDRRSGQRS
jgi:hypothetical protein